jgi:hypothetical protein
MNSGIRSDTVSGLGRAAHDIGLGALIGGNLFARVGFHPALGEIADERERGKVVNSAWRRYGTVNTLSLAAIVAGWAGARADEAADRMLSDRERDLARAKDAAVLAVAITGVASAIEGIRFGGMAPQGAVPLEDGSEPSANSSSAQATAKRTLNALGALHLASAVALCAINASLAQANFRCPPVRRLLRRRY